MSAYAESDWEAENRALLDGGAPVPCPGCGRTGFYGPRRADPRRRYRACTFCGFRQEVGKPAERDRAWSHGCEPWPLVAGAPHVEWAAPGVPEVPCPYCGRAAEVESHLVTAPADDPGHPWWKVPQGLSGVDYLGYWRPRLESVLPLFSRLYL